MDEIGPSAEEKEYESPRAIIVTVLVLLAGAAFWILKTLQGSFQHLLM